MQSPGFSEFRNWMDIWDEYQMIEASTDNIHLLIDGQGLILFFKKDGEVFGAPEDSRVVFARLKQPDDDTNKAWVKEASFVALNLSKAIHGERSQHVFSKKDLKTIQVIDKDDAVKALEKKDDKKDGCKHGVQMVIVKKTTHTAEPANMIPIDGGK